jgi:hypothetical protein
MTGKNETLVSVVAWVSGWSRYRISSFAPSGSAADVGIASPASTGMKALPSGPDGAGKATKASGSDSTASTRRTTWSQATQTSPDCSGSCMKPYVVDCGLTYCHVSVSQFHISTAASLVNVVFTPPVKAG